MRVVANGEAVELPEGAALPDLFKVLGVQGKWVLVELNGEPLERASMASTSLHDGDKVELVRAVAGG